MKNNCRMAGMILAAVCFMLTATNLTLALHLSAHDHDEGHHSDQCRICQQAAVLKDPALLPEADVTIFSERPFSAVEFGRSSILTINDIRIPPLRAPPAIL